MKRKEYIKPELEIVSVATQSMIAASLPSSPGKTPGIIGIKANPFDEEMEDLVDFDSEINGLLW